MLPSEEPLLVLQGYWNLSHDLMLILLQKQHVSSCSAFPHWAHALAAIGVLVTKTPQELQCEHYLTKPYWALDTPQAAVCTFLLTLPGRYLKNIFFSMGGQDNVLPNVFLKLSHFTYLLLAALVLNMCWPWLFAHIAHDLYFWKIENAHQNYFAGGAQSHTTVGQCSAAFLVRYELANTSINALKRKQQHQN